MLGMALAGLALALSFQFVPGLGLKQLWWVFNAIAACVVVPTVLSLYWDGMSERGVFWGVLVSFFIGLPLFVWANILDQPSFIVASSIFIILISTILPLVLKGPTKAGSAPE